MLYLSLDIGLPMAWGVLNKFITHMTLEESENDEQNRRRG